MQFRAAISLVGLCALSFGCGSSDEGWREIDLHADADFYDMQFLDSANGFLVGGGHLIKGGIFGVTRDGGETWKFRTNLVGPMRGSFAFSLNGVHFLTPEHGYLVGDSGKILMTVDGGESWRPVRHGTRVSEHIFDLHFADAENGWATGLCGLLRTDNGGHRWSQKEQSEAGWTLDGSAVDFADERTGFLVGHFKAIRRSVDGGRNWMKIEAPDVLPEDTAFRDVDFIDANRGWIVGEYGTILRTRDSGATWQIQSSGVGDYLSSVAFVDSLHGWAAGYDQSSSRAVVLGTRDGGAHWNLEHEIHGERLHTLFALDVNHVWAVGTRSLEGTNHLLRLRRSPAES